MLLDDNEIVSHRLAILEKELSDIRTSPKDHLSRLPDIRIENMATKTVSFETPLPPINEESSELKSTIERKNSATERSEHQVLRGLVDLLGTRATFIEQLSDLNLKVGEEADCVLAADLRRVQR